MLLALVCAFVFASRATSASSLQVPMLTMRMGSQNVTISNEVTVFNVTLASDLGKNTLNVSFHIDVTVSLKTHPTLGVNITENGVESSIPCLDDIGSCVYQLCDGNSTLEKEVTKAWNNTCPIPVGKYPVNMTLDLAKNKYLTSGDTMKTFNFTFKDGGNVTGFVSFPVDIPSMAGSSASALTALHTSWILTVSLLTLRFH
ncbi:hypothetical protein MRX96_025515 [Rhipicephalus microplus]